MTGPTPGARVGIGWMVWFTLAWLAIWTVQLTPIQLLLPLQLDTSGSNWIAGVVWSGVVLSAGGLAGIVVAPIAGRLSDRTRSPMGRRRPWAIGGSLVTAVGLVLTGMSHGPVLIGGAWIVVSVGIGTASAAFTALIADQLDAQKGSASAAASSAQALGIVVGVGAVVLLGLGTGASYWLLAGLITVIGARAALLLPDPQPLSQQAVRVVPVRRKVGELRISSLVDHNFKWLLISRFTVNVGNAFGTSLLLFFLIYGVHIPSVQAEDSLLVLILIYTLFVVIASIVVGMISDRSGHRRGWTIASALVQAASGVIIVISPTFATTAVAAGIMGAGYGAYMAVSLAFGTDLLLDPDDHARDLSLVNNSAALGQLVGPLLGAGLVAAVGGFWLLFAAAAAVSVLGAALTLTVHPNPSVSEVR